MRIGAGMCCPSSKPACASLQVTSNPPPGLAPALALCDDLQRRHPQRRLLVLMVNCRNRAAVAAYRKAGFVDTGELHRGGRAGPQHLMLRGLNDVGQSRHG